jgi:hypothetical protein
VAAAVCEAWDQAQGHGWRGSGCLLRCADARQDTVASQGAYVQSGAHQAYCTWREDVIDTIRTLDEIFIRMAEADGNGRGRAEHDG